MTDAMNNLDALLYEAWGLIANAEEEWKATPEWKEAVKGWREKWHRYFNAQAEILEKESKV